MLEKYLTLFQGTHSVKDLYYEWADCSLPSLILEPIELVLIKFIYSSLTQIFF